MGHTSHTPIELVRKLTQVGAALSSERDHARLVELILESAQELTYADGGTIYTCVDDHLRFEILRTESLGLRLGGSSGQKIDFPPIPLYDFDGRPNDRMIAARAVTTGRTINIPDAYADCFVEGKELDFSGTRAFDDRTGYRSKSFLTVPLGDHEGQIIGILQLINARDHSTGEIVPFSDEDQQLVESLASQAAITMTQRRLLDESRRLFESFIELIASAIDDKSPYTGSHCRRVPVITMMLAEAAAGTTAGPLAEFEMSRDDHYELRIAAWLHDCGKVSTPDYVVDKATKLQTFFDRMDLVETRFELLARDAEIAMLRAKVEALQAGRAMDFSDLEQRFEKERTRLDEEREFLRECNLGREWMPEAWRERVEKIGKQTWTDHHGDERPALEDDEIENLSIPKGTLNPREREIVDHHIVTTIRMLEALPYPKHLSRVPEFAGGHHERVDGRGYPRGLNREQMSVQARIMAIADIFEALTAPDRPYRGPLKLSEALHILGKMRLDGHVDPDLFDVFIRERVYWRYSVDYLDPSQLDAVDESQIPGYEPVSIYAASSDS